MQAVHGDAQGFAFCASIAHERLCCAAPCYTRQGWRWDIPEEDMALAAVSPTLPSLTHGKHTGQRLLLAWCQL